MKPLLIATLFLMTVFWPGVTCPAGERGPGKYTGVVVFDRWDGCMLYSGIYVMYVSENIKEELRPYAGNAIQIDATDVYQPINPGDGLIKACKYLGPISEGIRSWVTVDGLRLQCTVKANSNGQPVATIIVDNNGSRPVRLLTDELALTLLTKGDANEWTPYDGPSFAMITRQSFQIGEGDPRWHDTHWSIGKENALPDQIMLGPDERKTIDIVFDLPDGEYDFLCGYGGSGDKGLASHLVGFNVSDGRFVAMKSRLAMIPQIQVSRWPATHELVVGRLALEDHGMQQGARVLSIVVELKNRSGHPLNVDFDPHDLHTELFRSDGNPIAAGPEVRSGPVPCSHRLTISPDAFAGIPTHRGGIGLPQGQTLLAAGWQSWALPPGKYSVKGTVKVTADFGSATLDPLLPDRKTKRDAFRPAGRTESIELKLSEVQFEVRTEDNSPAEK